jgi:hypothetical protein
MEASSEIESRLRTQIGWDRIRSSTPAHVNEAIQRRLFELEREWSIDQALMTNLSVLGLAGVLAGAFHSRKWLWAPAIQLGFLFLHAARGWCPPTPLFRRLGFRTQKEIEAERELLKRQLESAGQGQSS